MMLIQARFRVGVVVAMTTGTAPLVNPAHLPPRPVIEQRRRSLAVMAIEGNI